MKTWIINGKWLLCAENKAIAVNLAKVKFLNVVSVELMK